jgi:hypothetical protein
MLRNEAVLLWLWAAGIIVGSCTDSELYHQSLEPNLPNKVAISGTVCTDDPSQRKFPVRLMFIIDNSTLMFQNDPDGRHVSAVENIINLYRSSANYSFSIITFADETKQLTPGYTQDRSQLDEALFQLGTPNAAGQRDWLSAVSLASSIYTGDLLSSSTGVRSRTRYVFIFLASGRPVPDIVTDAQNCNAECQLRKAVLDMATFGSDNGLAELAFHTVLVDDRPGTCVMAGTTQYCDSDHICPPNCAAGQICNRNRLVCSNNHNTTCQLDGNECAPSGQCRSLSICSNNSATTCVMDSDCCDPYTCGDDNNTASGNDRAAYLLKAMSAAGTGNFLRFLHGSDISFGSLKLTTTQSVFVKRALLVTNINSKFQNGETRPDSDADGLSDRQEACYHEILTGQCQDIDDCDCVLDVWTYDHQAGTDTDPASADTDGDGINDLIEILFATLSLDPLRFDLPAVCSELERPYLDSDGDGLNDCEEKILGTDPTLFDTDRDGYPDGIEFMVGTNPLDADSLKDTDMDGLDNGDELEQHLDPQANDIRARSGDSYRYKVVDEGLVTKTFTTQPEMISGVTITDVSARTVLGVGWLTFYPAGTHTASGQERTHPTLSWRQQKAAREGAEVEITADGDLLLYSGCECVKECPGGCTTGQWCDPQDGCTLDQCTDVTCTSAETCDPSNGNCYFDCAKAACDLGQRCDPLLHKCLTDRCLNAACQGGLSCEPESGICASGSPCQGTTCESGFRVDESTKPAWISVKVDVTQLPQSGFWCGGNVDGTSCKSDEDCPANSYCFIRENIVVDEAEKNCISFKVKNITLIETLETTPGFGRGLNNIFIYFAQVPLNNPLSYSIFRAAQVQIRYYNNEKDPDMAEVPLTDNDFFMVTED